MYLFSERSVFLFVWWALWAQWALWAAAELQLTEKLVIADGLGGSMAEWAAVELQLMEKLD